MFDIRSSEILIKYLPTCEKHRRDYSLWLQVAIFQEDKGEVVGGRGGKKKKATVREEEEEEEVGKEEK